MKVVYINKNESVNQHMFSNIYGKLCTTNTNPVHHLTGTLLDEHHNIYPLQFDPTCAKPSLGALELLCELSKDMQKTSAVFDLNLCFDNLVYRTLMETDVTLIEVLCFIEVLKDRDFRSKLDSTDDTTETTQLFFEYFTEKMMMRVYDMLSTVRNEENGESGIKPAFYTDEIVMTKLATEIQF